MRALPDFTDASLRVLTPAGLPAFPVDADTKRPLVAGGFKAATTDATVIERYAGLFPNAVPAVPTGSVSGIFVVDSDLDRETGETVGDATLDELGFNPAAHRYQATTRSGGRHLYFANRDGLPTGAGRIGPKVDTRGDGGYVVAWDPAALVAAKKALANGELPGLPEVLVQALEKRAWDVPLASPPKPPSSTPDRREQAYAFAALEGTFTELGGAREGERNDTLNRVAFRMGRMIGAGWIDQVTVVARLEQGCVANGIWADDGLRQCRATIASGIRGGLADPHDGLPSGPKENGGEHNEATSEWGVADLSLLGTGRRQAAAFPVGLLGEFWSSWAGAKARGASAPIDYIATVLLAATGGMLANVRWPLAGADWCEPPLLWACLVGYPSAGKSPAMDPVTSLLDAAGDYLARDFGDTLRDHDRRIVVAKAAREDWEREVEAAMGRGDVAPPRPHDADEPEKPERPRIRLDDATTERLTSLAAALPRGLLLVRDELAGWLGAFDKYGGNGSDRALALQMYGGRQHRVDRVKHPEGFCIRHLSIGVVGTIQPDRLGLMTNSGDDGLASRFLFAWPDKTPTFALKWEADDDDARARRTFHRLADLAMGSDDEGRPEPKRLPLTRAAGAILEAFASDAAAEERDAGSGYIGALGKARGHVLRLSCVLEHLWWCANETGPEPAAIGEQAVAAAAGFVSNYFLPMAQRVWGDASIPAPEKAAMTVARHLRKNRMTVFNARDVRRTIGGQVREAKAMTGACEELVAGGLIRARPTRKGATPGRGAKDFEVHPSVYEWTG